LIPQQHYEWIYSLAQGCLSGGFLVAETAGGGKNDGKFVFNTCPANLPIQRTAQIPRLERVFPGERRQTGNSIQGLACPYTLDYSTPEALPREYRHLLRDSF
jgi:hypothetical protein